MIKRNEMSISAALFYAFPNAYFLVRDIMCKAGNNYERILSNAKVRDEVRLERIITQRICRHEMGLTEGKGKRLPAKRQFQFREYRSIDPELAPASFLCPQCNKVYDLQKKKDIKESDFICPNCKSSLSQIVHIFTHPQCGNIQEIKPKLCYECKKSYFELYLVKENFAKSTWLCPNCKTKVHLSYLCNCSTDDRVKMKPMPAASAIKPMSINAVDVGSGWEECIDSWFRFEGGTLEEKILGDLPEPMREIAQRNMEADESFKEKMIADYKEKHPSERSREEIIREEIGEISFNVRRLLSEYKGATSHIAFDGKLSEAEASKVEKDFGLKLFYLDRIPLVTMVYGYLVGSTDEANSKLQLFDAGYGNYNVLTRCYESEALLVELSPARVVNWLNKSGKELDEKSLRKILLTSSGDCAGDIPSAVKTLLHTISHLMIRQSEIFSGISRDNLGEMVFTPAMSFVIFSTEGTELGALKSTFESQMYNWLHKTRHAAENCPYDPLCEAHVPSACHGCLYIAERSCNEMFNANLDRKLVVTISKNIGYWDKCLA